LVFFANGQRVRDIFEGCFASHCLRLSIKFSPGLSCAYGGSPDAAKAPFASWRRWGWGARSIPTAAGTKWKEPGRKTADQPTVDGRSLDAGVRTADVIRLCCM